MARVEEAKLSRKEKKSAKGRMSNFLMFLPNMVRLLGRLLKDSRVSLADKGLFAAAIFYVIMPLDLIPDVFPFIGQVDDIYMVALSLLRLINRTDANVIREHWMGGGDIVSLADTVAKLAPMLLPKRVTRVLTSRVELASNEKILSNIKGKKEPVMVVTSIDEKEIDSVSRLAN